MFKTPDINIENKDIRDSVIINQVEQNILPKSYEYSDLLDQLNTQIELFALLPKSETEKRLKVSGKINNLKDVIERFKSDVLQLARAFQNIDINTERLQRAKAFFDKGEFGEARAVLEIELEQMQDEQTHLLEERKYYETEVLPKLIKNAEEFRILALSTLTNYADPNRFENARNYFERSIKSHAKKSNIFQYALFLNRHNQFIEAEKYYLQYLNDFASQSPENEENDLASQFSRSEKAEVLNNLALLHSYQNRYEEALKEHEEALQIYRILSGINPNTYLPRVALTLNNLTTLYTELNNPEEALKKYQEASQIYLSFISD
jgi:tetratricopeptide (TPR) repeat protein